MFRVIGIKGNAVRFRSGVCTFDMYVIENNGHLRCKTNVFIHDKADFLALSSVAKSVYLNNSIKEDNSNDTYSVTQ